MSHQVQIAEGRFDSGARKLFIFLRVEARTL